MPKDVTITSIRFSNFKAFRQFSLSLDDMNVLVGPNNSGKSTILGACRVLSSGIRHARVRRPAWIDLPEGNLYGYHLADDAIPISLENVHTDYNDAVSTVEFRISNGNRLRLVFTSDRECYLEPEAARNIQRPDDFKREFPLTIGVVPVLGPVEHNETIVEEETVRRSLQTHRASRHFRNYWRYYTEAFDDFAELISKTWPGMEILRPERTTSLSNSLQMFCKENRISRELYWAGFGFQVWCQLLTHLHNARHDALLIVDEPEIYLHPDVQRQLLSLMRGLGPDVLIATHSTEVITEADPSEIIVIDKARQSGKRLNSGQEVQSALEQIGSVQNIMLSRLARNRRVLFVEGEHDFSIIRRFAHLMEYQELAAASDITPVSTGGFTSWEKIHAVAWGLEKTLGQSMLLAAVFDRDYWCDEELNHILTELQSKLSFAHIHSSKEIENYLLVPEAIDRAIKTAINDRLRRGGSVDQELEPATNILLRLTEAKKSELLGQYVAKRTEFLRQTGKDPATLASESISTFERDWSNLRLRLSRVDGKEILRELRNEVQQRWKVNFTDARIISNVPVDLIAEDMAGLLRGLENFRVQTR